ncbi:PucR family transcriptional regulator [Nocardia nova]|nr:helix-turn-helix domain-containing protein [Nocardia nova]
MGVALGRSSELGAQRPTTIKDEEDLRRHVEAAVTTLFGDTAYTMLGSSGGTILLPSEADERFPETVLPALTRAAGSPVSVTAVRSRANAISRATELAHDLLDIVVRLGYASGLYTLGDLTLEYQLTRPGPATGLLIAPLEPILAAPELIETLRHHIAGSFNRQKTATALGIHRNTVDYRLRRIKDLTGLDPSNQPDLLRLQSALIIHAYRTRTAPHA